MASNKLIKKFKTEIEKSLLLSIEDKKFWLENAGKLSKFALQQIYDQVHEKNKLVEIYIKTALADDTDQVYLKELKDKVKKLKKNTLKIAEKEEEPEAEKFLKEKLWQ